MQQYFGKLPNLVDNLAGNILSYALILAAVSTITMTVLELFKALFKLRPVYHKKKVKEWLGNNTSFDELLVLTVVNLDSADALFDQPTDKMMGQIQAAANVVVDFPDNYVNLYEFLSNVPEPYASDYKNQKNVKFNIKPEPPDAEVWMNFITRPDSMENLSPSSAEVQQATRARARIDHFVARKLDAFQTRTEFIWARQNQYFSVTASAMFLMWLLIYKDVPLSWSILLGFFGGMMAPLAKDVVTALSGLRTK